MACSGRTRRPATGRTRRSTTASSAGAVPRVRAHLRGPCRQGRPTRTSDDRCDPPQGASHGGEPAAKGEPRHIGRTKGGLNSKLHAACDGQGRPVALLLTEGQRSDHHGAAMLLPILPPARAARRPRLRQHLVPQQAGRTRHHRLHPVDTLAQAATFLRQGALPPATPDRERLGPIENWRRVATRYDRRAHTFFSAICIAASVTFWL